jgi:hypothetical protein
VRGDNGCEKLSGGEGGWLDCWFWLRVFVHAFMMGCGRGFHVFHDGFWGVAYCSISARSESEGGCLRDGEMLVYSTVLWAMLHSALHAYSYACWLSLDFFVYCLL